MPTTGPFKYQITTDSVMVVYEGTPHTATRGQANYKALRNAVAAAIISGDWSAVPALLTVAKSIEDWAEGLFTVANGKMQYEGLDLPEDINRRIISAVAAGEDPARYLRFWERLDRNPSHNSVMMLLSFLQHSIVIAPNGMLLTYKGIRSNFTDCHSGTFDNSVGANPKMKRWRVSEDPKVACHFGFHVGTRQYARDFTQGVIIICEVDPMNVVCVPDDHSRQKMRVCEYRVIGVDNGGVLPTHGYDEESPVDVARIDAQPTEYASVPIENTDDDDARATDGTKLKKGETRPMKDGGKLLTNLPLTGTDYDDLNDMDSIALMTLRIKQLRAYARFNCLIVGASKMRGGKARLVPAIIEARGYNDPSDRA